MARLGLGQHPRGSPPSRHRRTGGAMGAIRPGLSGLADRSPRAAENQGRPSTRQTSRRSSFCCRLGGEAYGRPIPLPPFLCPLFLPHAPALPYPPASAPAGAPWAPEMGETTGQGNGSRPRGKGMGAEEWAGNGPVGRDRGVRSVARPVSLPESEPFSSTRAGPPRHPVRSVLSRRRATETVARPGAA